MLKPALILLAIVGWITWWCGRRFVTVVILAAAFFSAGAIVAADARERALRTPLRAALDRQFGGFAIGTTGPPPRHDPIAVRAVLLEDAARGTDFTTLRAAVTSIRLRNRWQDTAGGATLSVGGAMSHDLTGEWRAGRTIVTSVTFRRPTRYLNAGVPDFEHALALDGTTLFGSVKSGLLVDIETHGSRIEEIAAGIRQHVRQSVERWVAPHDAVSAAIVTAVLIGDRTGLPDEIRLRLQAAGTYHVIAISGGNIAILAGLILAMLLVCGVTGRPAALVTLILLAAYAQVVTADASVWRATLMAVLYFGARVLNHRSSAWHALAIAAAVIVCVRPLDVRDAGFILTFGATAALLEGARRLVPMISRHRAAGWLIASIAATFAAEVALVPVSAWTFSRVTSAGLLLNLAAVPLMGLIQIGGIVVSCLDGVETIAGAAGRVAKRRPGPRRASGHVLRRGARRRDARAIPGSIEPAGRYRRNTVREQQF